MVREIAYDEVFDAQKHFRSLLDSMSRPGKINRLDAVDLNPPGSLNQASVLVAFALMDGDTTFEAVNMDNGEASYLAANTRSSPTVTEKANFIFANGSEAPEILESADCGMLTYPDTAATLILQLDAASREPLRDGLKLTLEGPGIQGSDTLFVRGMNPDLLLALQARNAEFPMGLDTILTFADSSGAPCVTGLPRTTKVSWEKS